MPWQVRGAVPAVLAGDAPHLRIGHAHHAAIAVLSTVALGPAFLLRLDAFCDPLHHLELLRVGEVPRGWVVAEDVSPGCKHWLCTRASPARR